MQPATKLNGTPRVPIAFIAAIRAERSLHFLDSCLQSDHFPIKIMNPKLQAYTSTKPALVQMRCHLQ
jgi:hypothetical protein